MDKLLLAVEDSFQFSARGAIIAPYVSSEAVGISRSGYKQQVRLVRPDGAEEIVEATFYWEHLNPGSFHFSLFIEQARKEQAPLGTQIGIALNSAEWVTAPLSLTQFLLHVWEKIFSCERIILLRVFSVLVPGYPKARAIELLELTTSLDSYIALLERCCGSAKPSASTNSLTICIIG